MYMFPIHWGLFRPLPSDDIMFSHKMTELLATFSKTGKPSISLGEDTPPFEWAPADPNSISHLNIGKIMRTDQGLPNHR